MKKNLLYIAAFAGVLGFFSSCTTELIIDRIDEGDYENVNTLVGTLRDASTNKVSNVVDLYKEDLTKELSFNLSRTPKKGVDVKVEFDAAYLDTFNAEHGTSFELYPQDKLTIQNEGKIVVAPNQKKSYKLKLAIESLGITEYKADATYVIPLKATTQTEGVNVSENESHLIYLVKNRAHQASSARKPGEKSVFCFLEVNDTNPLNILQWETEDGRLLVDYVCFFAYNINYNKETGDVYVFPNPQCQFILDHADQIIKPLRERGVKVILGLLGNHDAAGLAQLSPLGCKHFAKKLKAICDAYNFDGVNFDDEYSGSPDLSSPLMCNPSGEAATRLCLETKKAMPDKLVTIFQYGAMYGEDMCDGIEAGEFIDIAVANYGGSGSPRKGMTHANCSITSVEFARGGWIGLSQAQSWAQSDYGYVMIFAPWASGRQGSSSHLESLSNLSQGLLGSPLKKPEFYYPATMSFETKPF